MSQLFLQEKLAMMVDDFNKLMDEQRFAEAEVASRQESVIVAETLIRTLEDILRTQIMNPQHPDFWTTRIIPSEQPQLTPQAVDADPARAEIHRDRQVLG